LKNIANFFEIRDFWGNFEKIYEIIFLFLDFFINLSVLERKVIFLFQKIQLDEKN
tara:strand:+ start:583 stop:747 length:165 start_codon:yes stop_codon:yes gene_type:complete